MEINTSYIKMLSKCLLQQNFKKYEFSTVNVFLTIYFGKYNYNKTVAF